MLTQSCHLLWHWPRFSDCRALRTLVHPDNIYMGSSSLIFDVSFTSLSILWELSAWCTILLHLILLLWEHYYCCGQAVNVVTSQPEGSGFESSTAGQSSNLAASCWSLPPPWKWFALHFWKQRKNNVNDGKIGCGNLFCRTSRIPVAIVLLVMVVLWDGRLFLLCLFDKV